MTQLSETSEACPHCWDESVMRRPPSSVTVHKDECAYCCRTCEPHFDGIYVCMACFAGLCGDHIAKHMAAKPTHTMYTRMRELPEEKPADGDEEEVKDVYKLGVAKPKLFESSLCCGECKVRFIAVPELAVDSYTGIVNAVLPGAQEAAGEPGDALFMKPQCPHLVCLEQEPSPFTKDAPPTSEVVCSVEGCDCNVNNWMCVTCGAIGCPRAEAGGQAHAIKHFEETGHPTVVKLGTVTPEGADYYCYACDDDVADVHFKEHMAHFGVDVDTAKKTAKTMGEMQYDYSTQFDFDKITEAGSDLVPVYGPGHTGIRNIGNTCYLASVVQCLMTFQPFRDAFYPERQCTHQQDCTSDPYTCRACQTERLSAGLLSGEFSEQSREQKGIIPRLFKNVYAQKHPEFSTNQQQDAQEYFLYLLEEMKRFVKPAGNTPFHPSELFEMVMEQRVQCSRCRRVRYTCEKESCLSLPIPRDPGASALAAVTADGTQLTEEQQDELRPRCTLDECLTASAQPAAIECRCEACGEAASYLSTTKPRTFPDVLPVYLRRTYFDKQALTTKKMDVYVDVPLELDLSALRATGKREDEVEMPGTTASASAGTKSGKKEVVVDEVALVTVVSMGINVPVASYALRQTDMNVERAIDYIFSHPEIESEMAASEQASSAGGTVAGSHAMDSGSMPAKTAATDGAGKYTLTAMISHIGSGAKVGHYVCHIKDRETGKWLLFNDEKVGESQNPPFRMASLYFYQRAE